MNRNGAIIAHRGFSHRAPENTLAAIREAIEAGAPFCEFDVYRCGSGQVVLMHDNTVDRTTHGKGYIKQMSYDQLRQLDAGSWKHKRYKGEAVPTLDQALALLKASDTDPVIEIKDTEATRDAIRLVRSHGLGDRATLIAFDHNIVRQVSAHTPAFRCAWLCHNYPRRSMSTKDKVNWLTRSAAQCGARVIDLQHTMLTAEVLGGLHEANLTVWCYTVDRPKRMQTLQSWGIDAITTNRPDIAIAVSKRCMEE